ncbi:MAG: TrkA C-terminal domain-containing protein [Thermoplasmata archaeon]
MVEIIESDLPTVGKKFSMKLANDGMLTIIVYLTGKRDIYYENQKTGERVVFPLTDEEARKISPIIGGTYFRPTLIDQLQASLTKGMNIEWVKVPKTSDIAGKVIKDLDIRKKTDASIIAIIHGDATIPNPNPSTTINADDTLVVIGTADNIAKLKGLIGLN